MQVVRNLIGFPVLLEELDHAQVTILGSAQDNLQFACTPKQTGDIPATQAATSSDSQGTPLTLVCSPLVMVSLLSSLPTSGMVRQVRQVKQLQKTVSQTYGNGRKEHLGQVVSLIGYLNHQVSNFLRFEVRFFRHICLLRIAIVGSANRETTSYFVDMQV